MKSVIISFLVGFVSITVILWGLNKTPDRLMYLWGIGAGCLLLGFGAFLLYKANKSVK